MNVKGNKKLFWLPVRICIHYIHLWRLTLINISTKLPKSSNVKLLSYWWLSTNSVKIRYNYGRTYFLLFSRWFIQWIILNNVSSTWSLRWIFALVTLVILFKGNQFFNIWSILLNGAGSLSNTVSVELQRG